MSDREKNGAVPAIDRREVLRRVGLVPVAAGLAFSPARLQAAQEHVHKSAAKAASKGKPYTPRFFGAHEWATVRTLADQVIPTDERSGSASEALV
ncbi:MAG TPA: gluconate 2-dehydrogenase subunit 3 family protein, partial [Vicinamibacteria bacterium]|nr:gluconate 2-dehydrogenase subunit 3 family protein [Vicinamibacteria bacterium]